MYFSLACFPLYYIFEINKVAYSYSMTPVLPVHCPCFSDPRFRAGRKAWMDLELTDRIGRCL